MSVRKTIADELKAVGDALKAERHALADAVEDIWTKLTVGLPPAEHQALEDAHQVEADAKKAAGPVVAEAGHDAAAATGEAETAVKAVVGEAVPAVDPKVTATVAAQESVTGHHA